MKEMIAFLSVVNDPRESHKIAHTLSDIVMIVFFAHLSNCDTWKGIHHFAIRYESILKKVIPLENGIPSKDTICRVMSVIHPSVLEEVQKIWNEQLKVVRNQDDPRIIAIDGKTMRGNCQNETLPLHIVTAYAVEDGLSLGQTATNEKSNEITAIPKLLTMLKIAGETITIDAMGTQKAIAKQIRKQRANYVLAVKKNQKLLYHEIKEYLDDPHFEKEIQGSQGYSQTIESARSQIETRSYYQTSVISWMQEKRNWSGLKSIGKVVTTIERNGKQTKETRYYISSLPVEIEHFKKAVRGHWGIESMHWHLDVTFREDANHTQNKTAARNLNSIRKMAIPLLKELFIEPKYKAPSLRSKRFIISMDFPFYLGVLYEMFFIH